MEVNRQDYIYNYFKLIDMELSDLQVEQFIKYYDLLVSWNKVMNLTTIIEFKDVVIKHFIDSAYVAKYYDFNNLKVIDVGTGAGFPGIPLKILFPDMKILLLDSLNKRINFLNEVIDKLNLKDIKAVHSRAEDLGHNLEYREKFDIAISRAVANLSTLSEYCIPFIKENGRFLSYKSMNIGDEVNISKKALKILTSDIEEIHEYKLANTDIDRSVICIKKHDKLSLKYPRGSGKPSKDPL